MTDSTDDSIEETIADWVLRRGRNTGAANALARLYLALSRNEAVAPPFAAMVRGFDATRRAWFLEAVEAYAHGEWTGRHADAVAALYPAVVESLAAADDAFRDAAVRIERRAAEG